MSEREPIPDELAALFAAERSAPASDPRAREHVRSRLAAIVPALPGKAAAGAATSTLLAGTGKIIAIVAISIGVGVTAVGVATQSPPSTAPHAPNLIVEHDPIEAEPLPEHAARREEPEPALRMAAPIVPVANEAPPSEAKLIKSAWSALSTGDANRALELSAEAERLHPDGALVEEREALRIRALSKLGRLSDAESAAQKFLARYPRSVHRASIEHILQDRL